MTITLNSDTSRRITQLNYFCTILILIYHSSGLPVIGNIAMSYFWSTSGFFFYMNLRSEKIKEKINKRVYSLLIPYLLWNLSYYFINLLMRRTDLNEGAFLLRMLFDPYDGPLWYLLALFFMSLFSPLVLRGINKSPKLFCLSVLFVCFLFGVIFKTRIETLQYGFYFTRLLRYLPAYFFGVVIAVLLNQNEIDRIKEVLEHFKHNIYIAIVIIILFSTAKILAWTTIWGQSVCFILTPILPLSIWLLFSTANGLLNHMDNRLPKSAFFLYALHYFLIDFFRRIMRIVGLGFFTGSSICRIIVIPVMCICASFVVWLILYRISPKSVKVLTGGR